MSTVNCDQCKLEITERDLVVKAIRAFTDAKCPKCQAKLDVTVSADDVLMLPEPYRTDAMCAFSE
jgi:predicted nucleic acid-binding Zn ribbon protein